MASSNTKRLENKDSADLYSTPTIALDAIKPYLIKDINLNKTCVALEPCNGLGQISNWLKSLSNPNCSDDHMFDLEVETNELYNYGVDTDYSVDFLGDCEEILTNYDLIVTNPPYNRAVEFVLKGFEHAPVQWHFLRMSFIEGQQRFRDLFNLGKLSDVYVFTYRVSCPKGVDMEPSPNSVCYAWFRFDKNYCDQPRLHWLTKANLENPNV